METCNRGWLQRRRANADDGHEAAGARALLAIGEEEVGTASGAEVAHENVLGAKAELEKLGAVGFAKIEIDVLRRGLVAGRGHVEPLDGVGLVAGVKFVEPGGGVGELREEFDGDFDADFVAAAADGGAKGGEEVRGA